MQEIVGLFAVSYHSVENFNSQYELLPHTRDCLFRPKHIDFQGVIDSLTRYILDSLTRYIYLYSNTF